MLQCTQLNGAKWAKLATKEEERRKRGTGFDLMAFLNGKWKWWSSWIWANIQLANDCRQLNSLMVICDSSKSAYDARIFIIDWPTIRNFFPSLRSIAFISLIFNFICVRFFTHSFTFFSVSRCACCRILAACVGNKWREHIHSKSELNSHFIMLWQCEKIQTLAFTFIWIYVLIIVATAWRRCRFQHSIHSSALNADTTHFGVIFQIKPFSILFVLSCHALLCIALRLAWLGSTWLC